MPIFRYDKIIKNNILDIVPIMVAFKLSLLLPIASKVAFRGDWRYSKRQIGARNFKYVIPRFVLYKSFKKILGKMKRIIVTGVAINKDKDIPIFNTFFTRFLLLFVKSLEIWGRRLCDIAAVKKEGKRSKGRTYPEIIPYSLVI